MPVPILHRGRVRWDDGTGVAGALVSVASGTAPTPEIAIRCDADGAFRIALPGGTFQIEASAEDGTKARVDVQVDVQVDAKVEGGPQTIDLVLRRDRPRTPVTPPR